MQHATAIPSNDIVPQQRKSDYGNAIGEVVEGVANEFRERIKTAKEALDTIERRYLESAVKAKGALTDHVDVCAKLNDEVTRLQTFITEIGEQMEIPDPPRLTGQDAIDAKWDHERKLRNEAT